MILKRKYKERWDPVAGLLRVSLNTTNVILILVSMSIVIWQGYMVTNTYMSQPISTEQKLLTLDNVPNIQISICKSFEIKDCKLPSIIISRGKCENNQLPPYFQNQSDSYNFMSFEKIPIRNRGMLDNIWFWNESQAMWNTVYDRFNLSFVDENALFTIEMYPYSRNNTLLCSTLKKDIRHFAPMLRFQNKGNCKIAEPHENIVIKS